MDEFRWYHLLFLSAYVWVLQLSFLTPHFYIPHRPDFSWSSQWIDFSQRPQKINTLYGFPEIKSFWSSHKANSRNPLGPNLFSSDGKHRCLYFDINGSPTFQPSQIPLWVGWHFLDFDTIPRKRNIMVLLVLEKSSFLSKTIVIASYLKHLFTLRDCHPSIGYSRRGRHSKTITGPKRST